ncbi:uncharacterized protein BJ171DRAFT_487431 [Polychytrium aggregatum]|uniref:uncharacterized protein n=1 Tax=Polychytrium aggregatum TaxID=110093 RepID=UPI0022FE3697|nr:uncharacterized protein BJ171DRAFT_487431 [Polychytrium aggregatum]KAI9208815.1 hypothetical protein BJ171DRAFT_487431 [Polychytrium aggregatum]
MNQISLLPGEHIVWTATGHVRIWEAASDKAASALNGTSSSNGAFEISSNSTTTTRGSDFVNIVSLATVPAAPLRLQDPYAFTEPAGRRSRASPAAAHKLVLTNYKIYSPASPLGMTKELYIPVMAISQVELGHSEVTLTLRFLPTKYIIHFSGHRSLSTSASDSLSLSHSAMASSGSYNSKTCTDFYQQLLRVMKPSGPLDETFAFQIVRHLKNQPNPNLLSPSSSPLNDVIFADEDKVVRDVFQDWWTLEDHSSTSLDPSASKANGLDRTSRQLNGPGGSVKGGPKAPKLDLGWEGGYNSAKEFQRMRFGKNWMRCFVNHDFSVSTSYPAVHIVPVPSSSYANSPLSPQNQLTYPPTPFNLINQTSAGNVRSLANLQFFQSLSSYRVRGRFPSVCWKNAAFHQVIVRSSQPLTGILGNRSAQDELLISEIIKAVQQDYRATFCHPYDDFDGANEGGASTASGSTAGGSSYPPFWILDARGFAQALGNIGVGGGFENTANYPPSTQLAFLSLPNIHTIATSHQNLLKMISTSTSPTVWSNALESSGWITHVIDLLKAAGGKDGMIGKIVDSRASILVHCSDGWDRTTQLVSLAQILLDPYYRTIEGLRVLIEREWVAFGHPFNARNEYPPLSPTSQSSPGGGGSSSHSPYSSASTLAGGAAGMFGSNPISASIASTNPTQIPPAASPIFILFLTCLHYLVMQYPNDFEYNDRLLAFLGRVASGYGSYGDFLCNNEYERQSINLRERTLSVWHTIKTYSITFKNVNYQKPLPLCTCKQPSRNSYSHDRFYPYDEQESMHDLHYPSHHHHAPPSYPSFSFHSADMSPGYSHPSVPAGTAKRCTSTHCCYEVWMHRHVLRPSFSQQVLSSFTLWEELYFPERNPILWRLNSKVLTLGDDCVPAMQESKDVEPQSLSPSILRIILDSPFSLSPQLNLAEIVPSKVLAQVNQAKAFVKSRLQKQKHQAFQMWLDFVHERRRNKCLAESIVDQIVDTAWGVIEEKQREAEETNEVLEFIYGVEACGSVELAKDLGESLVGSLRGVFFGLDSQMSFSEPSSDHFPRYHRMGWRNGGANSISSSIYDVSESHCGSGFAGVLKSELRLHHSPPGAPNGYHGSEDWVDVPDGPSFSARARDMLVQLAHETGPEARLEDLSISDLRGGKLSVCCGQGQPEDLEWYLRDAIEDLMGS